MILADTSAWVEFDRATGSPAHLRVRELVADGGLLAVTEPVQMEILAGARHPGDEVRLRAMLARHALLGVDAAVDFDAAASIYRSCRRVGVTPRGIVDCMIAAVARRRGAVLLAHDVDLDRVASVMGIAMDQGSLRA